MPKLPIFRWLPTPPGYAERLARWRQLWLIEQQLRSDHPEYAQPLPFAPRHARITDPMWTRLADPGVADISPAVGQIRLLSGWTVPDARRPVYVAVLLHWEGDVLLLAPFGPFPEPATTTELLTGRQAASFQVLSLWNARSVPPGLLSEASRYVDSLSPQELEDARAVFRHAMAGEDMAEFLWARVGCPIVHPQDPRIAYQDEETRLLVSLGEATRQWLEEHDDESTKDESGQVEVAPSEPNSGRGLQPAVGSSGRGIRPPGFAPPPPFLKKREEWSLSLSTGEPQSTAEKAVYMLAEIGVRLVMRFETNREMVSIKIRDLSGNPSPTLDGARVLNPAGAPVCVIAGQAARVPWRDLAQGLAISTSDGRVLVPELLV